MALGGNALAGRGRIGTTEEQLSRLRGAARALTPLLERDEIVVAHGNGPQVGAMLVRHERAAAEVPPHPLHLIVAETQAELGSQIAEALREVTTRPVACILTHVLVSGGDAAFQEPTKPIGPVYDEQEARALERDRGWLLAAENGHWRRVVASPRPREIVELAAIRALVDGGSVAVACGGGGIPVIEDESGDLHGVEAVIDKDLASSLLAGDLRADGLLILTDVEAVMDDYGSSDPRNIASMTVDEARERLSAGEFAPGSMGPKVEAAVAFEGRAGITSLERLREGVEGTAGTQVAP